MKKNILVLSLIIGVVFVGLTQNLSLSTDQGALEPNEPITIVGQPGSGPIAHVYVTNNGSDPVSVKVKKIENFLVDGAAVSICWGGNCFGPDVFVSPTTETINPGETNTTGFSGDYFDFNFAGLSSVSFVFFDENHVEDSVMVVVLYDVTNTTGSIVLSNDEGDIPANGMITFDGTPDESILGRVYAKNSGSTAIDVHVRRISNYIVDGSVNQFCWGLCFLPTVDLSTSPINIEAGATNTTDFYGEYFPEGNSGLSRITYVFFNATDPSDYTAVNVNFDIAVTGVEDIPGSGIELSEAYPNPADNFVYFNYDLSLTSANDNTNLFIYNILGSVVKELNFTEVNGKASIYTGDLDEGLYFYSLISKNETIKTDKLIIKH
ncbi:MAG: T9SS type A sorting domain-containing protein [Bacteroidales bacterium]|nr:T9SS type A sorting domain-containing protein [Bacteroidales bacterium]